MQSINSNAVFHESDIDSQTDQSFNAIDTDVSYGHDTEAEFYFSNDINTEDSTKSNPNCYPNESR